MGAGVTECGLWSDPPDGGRCDRMLDGGLILQIGTGVIECGLVSDPPDGDRCDRT